MENKDQINDNFSSKTLKFYKRWWFWTIIVVIIIIISIIIVDKPSNVTEKKPSKISSNSQQSSSVLKSNNILSSNNESTKKQVTITDFSTMSYGDAEKWCKENNIEYYKVESYSDTVEKDNFISQNIENGTKIDEGKKVIITYSLGKEPSMEFKNALKKANSYAKTLSMSKQSVFEQLTSEHGEQFSDDAAQYAIDNMTADWNSNALTKAKSYQSKMSMSRNAIYNQLISEHGEKFTKEEAQYAIDNLDK